VTPASSAPTWHPRSPCRQGPFIEAAAKDQESLPLPERPLRILELRTVRGTGGGPEKTILLGTARTDPARYAITICYIRDARDDEFHVHRRAQDLPVDYVEVRERNSFDPGIWPELRALVRDRQIDIVHAHDYKTDLLAWMLSRRTGVIPMATAHGWTGHSARERYLYYPGDRWLLARMAHVVAVSSDIRSTLLESGAAPHRVTVVLNAIDAAAFRRDRSREAAARARFGFTTTDLVLGAVGRLEPQKDFAGLIDAFADIAARIPCARLAIAGDGSLRQALHDQIARLRLESRVRLLGHVSDVAALHHAFDLFVQSSIYEGTPNAVLEAMAFETPIVATDAGGTAELARHGVEALIVPFRNRPALTMMLLKALGSMDASAGRAAAARRRVETELSFDARLRRVEKVYDALAAAAGKRTAAGLSACATS
jgi:glycosyltransferase involved in cell wall biosynthesis